MKLLLCITFLTFFAAISCYYIKPGPQVIATKGEVWPKPQRRDYFPEYMIVQPQNFKFHATNHTCSILEEAFERYLKIILNSTTLGRRHKNRNKGNSNHRASSKGSNKNDLYFVGYLTTLNVELSHSCGDNDIPAADMDEKYTLTINQKSNQQAILTSKSIWGILRGLETFSQILFSSDSTKDLIVNSTSILDYPRFHHRGLLLDTSRHYMPMFIILQIIDAMAFNKMNIFHWHIVDDQSFPYESKLFPELSAKGAYHKTMVYKPEDVKKVIKHAANRGIRVMVEFDTPGHTRSWGEGHPEILTRCYTKLTPNEYLGPIDPTKKTTYTFLKDFFKEVIDTFPDQYIHLGGDEVDFDCWESNPHITKWMMDHEMENDYNALEEYYIQQLVDIVDEMNSSSVVWEEVFANGVQLPKETIIHVWIDGDKVLPEATKQGYRTIWSSCWYLDHLDTGGDWQKYYKCDPFMEFDLSPEQQKYVIGGEACMWSETVDATNVVQRIWPRASAAAEKLWSSRSVNSLKQAAKRLEEHACRMNKRGIPAQPPNGPGFCF